jgi:transposase InsO family protein
VFKNRYRTMPGTKKRGPPKGVNRKRAEHKDKVIAAKKEHPFPGSAKIAGMTGVPISAPTVCGILKDEGLVKPRRSVQKVWGSFSVDRPNGMWQTDHVEAGPGKHMLSVPDDHSRKALSNEIRETTNRNIGKDDDRIWHPGKVLSDHGCRWYAVRGGESRFDVWCGEHRIKHITGGIRKPTAWGKVERRYRNPKSEGGSPLKEGATQNGYNDAATRYAEFYNKPRPHRGIGLKTPDEAYCHPNAVF